MESGYIPIGIKGEELTLWQQSKIKSKILNVVFLTI